MKKRILLISPAELCVGGVSKVIMTLVEELHEEYTFDIVTLCAKPGIFDDAFSAYGGKIYRIPAIEYQEHKILYPLSFFQIKSAIMKILKENSYDIIHGHSGWQDAVCHMAAARMGVPVRISHGHGTYARKGRNFIMRFYFWVTKRVLRKYATVRLACASIAGDTLFLGDPYENILNPVDISQYVNIEKEPHTGINLLQIGYFCKLKNQLFSLSILNHLRKEGTDARLAFIGYPKEQAYLENMRSVIAQYNLEAYVTILPHDSDKRAAFAQADYSLLPSESEGLPLVALESQAAGVPCLMSDNISNDSDVGAALFLPHNDLDEWAAAIRNGVEVDTNQLAHNLQKITVQTYIDRIRHIYE